VLKHDRAINRAQFHRILLIIVVAMVTLTACTLPGSETPTSEPVTFDGVPTVTISTPPINATFREGTDVNILARIENAGPDIARLEIKLNDTIIGQSDTPNPSGAAAFTVTNSWPATIVGAHTISITVTRADGSVGSQAVPISVLGEPTPIPPTDVPQADAQTDTTQDTTTSTDTTQTGTSTNTDTTTTVDTNAQPATAVPTEIVLPSPVPVEPTEIPPTEAPTDIPATATPSVPIARVIQGANVRNGPGTVYAPPVGSVAANEELEIVARNAAGDWYQIRYFQGTAWIFASLVEVSGNVNAIRVETNIPPTPIQATNTPVATSTPEAPASTVNLIVDAIAVNPHPLVCNQASTINVTVTNNGTDAIQTGSALRVEAILISDGSVLSSTIAPIPPLAANSSATAQAFLTVTTNIAEEQAIRAIVDSNNEIVESNENDNSDTKNSNYVLGACP